jgi:hypothetical protein
VANFYTAKVLAFTDAPSGAIMFWRPFWRKYALVIWRKFVLAQVIP